MISGGTYGRQAGSTHPTGMLSSSTHVHTTLFLGSNMVKNYENVVEPLEKIFGRMVQAHKTARAMAYIKGVKNIEYLKAYKRVCVSFVC